MNKNKILSDRLRPFVLALMTIAMFSILPASTFAQLFPNLGGQRTGTAALQFLKIGTSARATGMGESFVAVSDDISSLYWNPAGLVQFKDKNTKPKKQKQKK